MPDSLYLPVMERLSLTRPTTGRSVTVTQWEDTMSCQSNIFFPNYQTTPLSQLWFLWCISVRNIQSWSFMLCLWAANDELLHFCVVSCVHCVLNCVVREFRQSSVVSNRTRPQCTYQKWRSQHLTLQSIIANMFAMVTRQNIRWPVCSLQLIFLKNSAITVSVNALMLSKYLV